MPSSNKTSNLALNQWADTDKPKWADHNVDNQKIDGAFGALTGYTGLNIIDRYDTLANLQTAIPEPSPGNAYAVGVAYPYDIYVYGETAGWINHGHIQGVPGENAPQVQYEFSADASSWHATFMEGDEYIHFSVDGATYGDAVLFKGPRGIQGIQGEQGAPGPNEISELTTTPLNGILKGDGSTIGIADPAEILWTGTWDSGSITVPGFDEATLLAIITNGSVPPVLCYKQGGELFGGGYCPYTTGSDLAVSVKITYSGNVLTLVFARYLLHAENGQHSAFNSRTILRIIRIM